MDAFKENKLFFGIIGVALVLILCLFVGKLAVNKVSDMVIQKLQKEYSPSPYGPGFDPDRVNPDFFRNKRAVKGIYVESNLPSIVNESDRWRAEWERERGASLEP